MTQKQLQGDWEEKPNNDAKPFRFSVSFMAEADICKETMAFIL